MLQSGKLKMHGLLAWFGWAAIHILYLSQNSLRISVFLQWLWTFFTGRRGSRLIVEKTRKTDQVSTFRNNSS